MHHHLIHAAVELGDKAADKAESSLHVAQAISASEAFRKYDWLKSAPVRNLSGNFRGMVVSRQWANVYEFTDKVLEPVEKVALLAGLADNLAKAHFQIDAILNSKSSWDVKASQLSTQVSSVAIRTVAGGIPATADLLAMSIGGYCQIAGLAGWQGALKLNQRLKTLDSSFDTWFEKVTDGNNMYLFINSNLVIK